MVLMFLSWLRGRALPPPALLGGPLLLLLFPTTPPPRTRTTGGGCSESPQKWHDTSHHGATSGCKTLSVVVALKAYIVVVVVVGLLSLD